MIEFSGRHTRRRPNPSGGAPQARFTSRPSPCAGYAGVLVPALEVLPEAGEWDDLEAAYQAHGEAQPEDCG